MCTVCFASSTARPSSPSSALARTSGSLSTTKTARAALGRNPGIVRVPIEPVCLALAAAERLRLPLPFDSGQVMRLREDKAYPYESARRDLDYAPRPFREGVALEVARLRRLGMVQS